MIPSFRTGDFQNTGQALSAHRYIQTVRNYGNTAIDARLTTLFKNESATGVDLFVADPQGEIGSQGYEISWMAVGEID